MNSWMTPVSLLMLFRCLVCVEVVRDNSVVGPNNVKAGRVDIPAKRSLLITALGKY